MTFHPVHGCHLMQALHWPHEAVLNAAHTRSSCDTRINYRIYGTGHLVVLQEETEKPVKTRFSFDNGWVPSNLQ